MRRKLSEETVGSEGEDEAMENQEVELDWVENLLIGE